MMRYESILRDYVDFPEEQPELSWWLEGVFQSYEEEQQEQQEEEDEE